MRNFLHRRNALLAPLMPPRGQVDISPNIGDALESHGDMKTLTLKPPIAESVRPEAPPHERAAWRTRRQPRRFLGSLSPASWACIDVCIIGLASALAHTIMIAGLSGFGWTANPWLVSGLLCVATIISGLVFGLYERQTLQSRGRILVRSVLTVTSSLVLTYACVLVFFYAQASRWIGLVIALMYLCMSVPLRLYAHNLVTNSPVRLLCLGEGGSIRRLIEVIGQMHHDHYDVVGYLRVPQGPLRLVAGTHGLGLQPRFHSEQDLAFQEVCPALGTLRDLPHVLEEEQIDEVVVGTELASDPAIGQAVAPCLENRCRITDQATFVEKLLAEVPVENITAEWFLRADVQNRGNYEIVSRIMDVVVSAIGLLMTAPFLPLVALIVRLDSSGPAIYKQIRVGQYGRCFTIYKFRTMRQDAEKNGAQWAKENDNRVTRIGRFLRKSRIDEIPQLVNILRGDMSLVGPRPERPEFVRNLEQLLPHYRLRHLAKPGLTGWAQIHYRYGDSVADAHRKLCFDLHYLKHRSLEFDLAILIRTFGTFVLGAR